MKGGRLEWGEGPARGWRPVPRPVVRPVRPKRLPVWWPRAKALLEQGQSLKSVGETVGVTSQRVQQVARKAEGQGEVFERRRQNPPAPRPCAQCGTVFRPHSEKSAYCSRQCAGRARSEKALSDETVRRAFELRTAGKSYREIADIMRISPDRSWPLRQRRARHFIYVWARRAGVDPPGPAPKPRPRRRRAGN